MEQILEFLSSATEQELRPIQNLDRRGYLLISSDKEGEDFVFEFVGAIPIDPEAEISKQLLSTRKTLARRDGFVFVDDYAYLHQNVVDWFWRLPEAYTLVSAHQKYNRAKFKVTATYLNALMVHFCWPEEKILFADELAKTRYEVIIKRFAAQSKRAEDHARFKVEKILPKVPKTLSKVVDAAPEETRLSDYQIAGASLSYMQSGYGLFMDRGTGKTATAIGKLNAEAIETKRGNVDGVKRMMRVLIICPKQVRLNWVREIQKFTRVPGKVMAIRDNQLKRIAQLIETIRDEEDCYFGAAVMSYDTVSSDIEALSRVDWDLIIADESHKFKDERSKRFKSLKKLRPKALRTLALTGTPICNSYIDLWTQFEFIGVGQSGFKNPGRFRKYFGRFETVGQTAEGHTLEQFQGFENLPLLKEMLTRLSFSVSKEEAGLELPEKVYDQWEIEMTPKQTKLYTELRDKLKVEVAEADMSNQVTANHVLTKLLRLAQITAGFVTWDAIYDEEGTEKRAKKVEQIEPGKNPKIQAVLDILKDDTEKNEKVLIWAVNVADIHALEEAVSGAGHKCLTYYGDTKDVDRQANEDAFNEDPEVKCLILNPMAASEGLNLVGYNYRDQEEDWTDTYTGLEIFFSQNWSAVMRQQAEDRGHRRGTRKTVRIRDLTVINTIDEEIRKRVTEKIDSALEIQDIQNILENVLN